MPRAARYRRWPPWAAAAAAIAAGCAGYAGDVKEIRSSLLAGDPARALAFADSALGVDEPDQYPVDVGGDTSLLVLERAAIKHALGSYKSSALDYLVADKNLELLDLKHDTAGNIGKWLFSDDVTAYKAPPHEKLLLNTLNMLNYLSRGDLEGARVEARRFTIARRYVADAYSPAEATLAIGEYLSGFTYEMSGRYDQALQYYDRAAEAGLGGDVDDAVRRLAACDSYRSERITALLAAGAGGVAPTCAAPRRDRGTVLFVVSNGLAPYKRAIRVPIGAALVIAADVMYGPSLGASSSAQANELAAKGLLTWLNFPDLVRSQPRFARATASADGRPAELWRGQDVAGLVAKDWDTVKGTLMAAAIVRMIARAVAAEATQKAAEAGGAAGGVALLAGLAVEGAMFAADTPDTRSWVTLPAEILVARAEVPVGRHRVAVAFDGAAGRMVVERDVDVAPGGFAVVSAASMR